MVHKNAFQSGDLTFRPPEAETLPASKSSRRIQIFFESEVWSPYSPVNVNAAQ